MLQVLNVLSVIISNVIISIVVVCQRQRQRMKKKIKRLSPDRLRDQLDVSVAPETGHFDFLQIRGVYTSDFSVRFTVLLH